MPLDVRPHIRDGDTYALKQALLVYERAGRFGSSDAVVTLHAPRTAADGAIEIGPGQCMTAEQIAKIATELVSGAGGGCTYLPDTVLASGASSTVWWRPAGTHPMIFGHGAAKAMPGLSGQPAPHPALVFAVSGNRLSVFALAENARPKPDTELQRAPYPNIYASGNVCLGSAEVPQRHGVDVMADWESGFLNSAFTHTNPSDGAVVRHKGGMMALWRKLIREARDSFPADKLVPAKLTLGDLIAGRTGDRR